MVQQPLPGRSVLAHPRRVVVLAAVAAALALAALPRLRTDFGLGQLVPADDPSFRRYEQLLTRFGRDDNTVAVFVTDPDLMTRRGAERIVRLADELGRSRLVEQVTSLATAPVVVERLGMRFVRPAFDPERLERLDYPTLGARLAAEPLLAGRLLADDARTTALYVAIRDRYRGDRYRREVLAHVDAVLARHRAAGGDVLVTGNAATRAAYLRLLADDYRTLLPASAALLAVATWLWFRRWSAALVPLVTIGLSQLLTFATMALVDLPVNLLGASIPVVLTIVASADAVHLVERFAQELAAKPRAEALADALDASTPALVLTSLTTAAGFVALTASGIPMLAAFGSSVAIGIGFALAVSLTLTPTLLLLLPEPPPRSHPSRLGGLARVVCRWPRWTTASFVVAVVAVAAVGLPRVRVESKLVDDVDPTSPIAVTRAKLAMRLGGTFPLTLVAHVADGADTALRADFVRTVADFTDQLRGDLGAGVATSAVSLADLVALSWRAQGEDTVLPDSDDELAVAFDGIDDDELAAWHTADGRGLRIDLRLHDVGTAAMDRFLTAAEAGFTATADAGARLEPQGFAYLAHQVHKRVVGGAVRGFTLSMLAVCAILLWSLRSPRTVALAVLPNLVPAAVTLGVMGLAGVDLRISSCVVFAIVFGIAVDDTVHFLARYREARAAGDRAGEAVVATMATTGRALVGTSFILAAGFLVLVAGAFVPNRVLGGLMAVSVSAALAADLVLLPALLAWLDRAPDE